MINPNIHKRLLVAVNAAGSYAVYKGYTLPINYRYGDKLKKPGKRYLYLRYSILNEYYYLTVN